MLAMTEERAIRVRQAGRKDAERIFETLGLAFAADPVARWFYSDAQLYRRYFTPFVSAFGGGAIALGTAFVTEGCAGAALWLGPEAAPDEETLARLMDESIEAPKKPDAFAIFEEMAGYHPDGPHWYLPLIGVAPTMQGRGHGAALMKRALRYCDAEGLPAYLEATSARSVPFYAAHGFEAVGEIRRGGCPPIVPMIRFAR